MTNVCSVTLSHPSHRRVSDSEPTPVPGLWLGAPFRKTQVLRWRPPHYLPLPQMHLPLSHPCPPHRITTPQPAVTGDAPTTFPGLALPWHCSDSCLRDSSEGRSGPYRGTLRQSELLKSPCLLDSLQMRNEGPVSPKPHNQQVTEGRPGHRFPDSQSGPAPTQFITSSPYLISV